MKFRFFYLTLFFYLQVVPIIGQGLTQIVKGKVVDKESKTPLIGVSIAQLNGNTSIGTITNNEGEFSLRLPVGRQSLKFSYMGYEDVVVPNLVIISGKETYLPVEMLESVIKIKEVVITAGQQKDQPLNSMATVSARMLTPEDGNRYAAGYSDPARMVSSFAGVAPTEGDKNNIIIRGNSSRGLLWRLEGIEIPSPNHFTDGQGDAGGSFCIINSNLLSNSDFFTGAFPAEYGNALAGVLDLNLRKGNSDKHEYAIQVGVVGTELNAEGPLGKKGGSYLISYRYSNFKSLENLGLLDLGKNRRAPVFQDLALNITIPTAKAGTFSLFGVGGTSTTGKNGIRDSLLWIEDNDYRTDEVEVHRVGLLGIKHTFTLANKKTFIKTIVAASDQYDKWDMGFIINRQYKWYKSSLTNHYATFTEKYNTFSYPSLQYTTTVNHKFNANHTIRTGIVFRIIGFDMYAQEFNFDKAINEVLVNKNAHTNTSQAFVQWKYRPSEKIEINTGIHGLLFGLNKHYSVEPRLGIKWQLSDKSSINYGFGIHSRVESIAAYYTYTYNPDGSFNLPNKNINFTRSIHNVIGYDWSINSNIRLKVEAYHQYLYNIPIKNNPTSTESAINGMFGLPDTIYSNKGLGRNYGIELTLEKFFSNNYYFLITGSVFESKYKAGNGQWYNTVFNNNYVTNWLIGKDFVTGKEKQNIFSLNFKLFFMGGFRYTPVDFNLSGDDPYYITSRSFQKQTSNMFRLDLGLKFRKNKPKYSWIVSLDIQNLTNRKNVLGYEYQNDGGIKWLKPTEGLPMIPILSIRFEF